MTTIKEIKPLPPYRVGKHNPKAIVDANGVHVGNAFSEEFAQMICDHLNIPKTPAQAPVKKPYPFTRTDATMKYVDDILNREDGDKRIPIYRGCNAAGGRCFCTGVCQQIIGWEDPVTGERTMN